MKDNYHDSIIKTFCEHIDSFEKDIGFLVKNIETNVYLDSKGELDIVLEGYSDEKALIEVKSNNGLMGKFLTKQFEIYQDYDSKASIFLLYGTKEESLKIEDLTLKKFQRRRGR